jgi:hypothetical protein
VTKGNRLHRSPRITQKVLPEGALDLDEPVRTSEPISHSAFETIIGEPRVLKIATGQRP